MPGHKAATCYYGTTESCLTGTFYGYLLTNQATFCYTLGMETLAAEETPELAELGERLRELRSALRLDAGRTGAAGVSQQILSVPAGRRRPAAVSGGAAGAFPRIRCFAGGALS